MAKKALIALALIVAFSVGMIAGPVQPVFAYGFCSQPRVPSAYLSKPNKPFCAGMGECSKWQIDSYQREVRSYFDNLRRYAGEIDGYYNDAQKYIKCMSELD